MIAAIWIFGLFVIVAGVILVLLPNPRWVAAVEFYNLNTGAMIVTLSVPTSGTIRVGIRYRDQFKRLMPAPPVDQLSVQAEDPVELLTATALESDGNVLRIATGAVPGSATVTVSAFSQIEAPLHLDIQAARLASIEIDEAGAVIAATA